MSAFECIVGDRRTPIGAVLYQGDRPVDLSGLTVTFSMYLYNSATLKVTAQSATVHPTQTFTADSTTDLITANGHKASTGDQIIVSTLGSLPGGLAVSTRYFVVNKNPNTFQLASVPNGAAIDITSAGSGTHSFYIVGSVTYSFAAVDVDTAGYYEAYWAVTEGGLVTTFPSQDHGQSVFIKAKAVVG